MTQSEPAEEASTFLDVLAFIGSPVIEGLTIVAAGYALFLLQRRARRKEIALLVEALLATSAEIINATFIVENENEIASITNLIRLEKVYEEFGRISDKMGLLGHGLMKPTNMYFQALNMTLTTLEMVFPSAGPTSPVFSIDSDFPKLNRMATEYLLENWSWYERLVVSIFPIAAALSKLTGSKLDALNIETADWAPKKAMLESQLSKNDEKGTPADDQGEAVE